MAGPLSLLSSPPPEEHPSRIGGGTDKARQDSAKGLSSSVLDDYLTWPLLPHNYLTLTTGNDHLASTRKNYHLPISWGDIYLTSTRANVPCSIFIDL